MHKWMTMASTLALVATASAQPNGVVSESPEIDPDPLYHVEVILFAFNEGNRGEEDFHHGLEELRLEPLPQLLRLPRIELESVFNLRQETDSVDLEALPDEQVAGFEPALETDLSPSDPQIAPEEDALEFIETGFGQEFARSTSDETLPAGFRALTSDELELGATAARMNRRPYTLLGYAGWAQVGVDTDRSFLLDLKRVGITNPVGTIEIYLRRFLHVRVDLKFFDGNGTLWNAPAEFGLAPFAYAESYQLTNETNAIRSGELHFVDHPLFGMLIRITPAPEPEDEPGNVDTDRPAG